MAVTLLCGGRQTNLSALSFQWPFASLDFGTTTESAIARPLRGSGGTFYRMHVNVDATATGRAIQFRKNLANGNLVVSPTDSTAGQFVDDTHSDTLVLGDTFDVQFSGSAVYIPRSFILTFYASTGTVAIYGNPIAAFTPSTSFTSISGGQWLTTESQTAMVVRAPATHKNLIAVVIAAPTTNETLTSRKNSGAGNMTVTLTANTTGLFEDTTNSDSVVSGDTYNFQLVGTTFLAFTVGYTAVCTSTVSEIVGPSGVSVSFNAATRFTQISTGNEATVVTTESAAQCNMPIDGTLSNARLSVTVNTMTSTWTRQLRINGANATQVLSVGAGATGNFEDATHTDFFRVGDLVNFSESGGTANSLAFNWSMLTVKPLDYAVYPDWQRRLPLREVVGY